MAEVNSSTRAHHGTASNDVEIVLGVLIGFIVVLFIVLMRLFFTDGTESNSNSGKIIPSLVSSSIKIGTSLKLTKVSKQVVDFDVLEVEDIEDENIDESVKKKPEKQIYLNSSSNV